MAIRKIGLCIALLASASLLGGWTCGQKPKKKRCAQRTQRVQRYCRAQRRAPVRIIRRAPVRIVRRAPVVRVVAKVAKAPAPQPAPAKTAEAKPASVIVAVKLPTTSIAPKVTIAAKDKKAVVIKTDAPGDAAPETPAPADEVDPRAVLEDIVSGRACCPPSLRRRSCRPRMTLGQLLGLCCKPRRCCPPVSRCCGASQMPIGSGGGL